MPYVEGESLRAKLAREGELPITDAVRILRDVVDALTDAHAHGVVHRDIKPDNVLLTKHHAVVTDFGVAKAVSEATGRQQLTTTGVALGTPAYMAPEQAVADPHIDHRADIYAVGAVAYELLTGRPPFTGTTPQMVLSAHVTEAPEPVTKDRHAVPPALAPLVMKCLEKKPADRWQSAEELLPQLEALATPSGGVTPTDTRPVAAVSRLSTRTGVLAIAAVVFVVGVVGGLFLARNGVTELTIGRTTQLTRGPELEVDPAISPNGDMIAFAAGPADQMRIFVRQMAGGRTISLTDDQSGHYRGPQWSPDGSQIAFQSEGSIHLIPALGGTSRRLVAASDVGTCCAAWSPDGEWIAYVQQNGIYVRSVDTGESRRIAEAYDPHSVTWSPDGSRVAYVSGNSAFVLSTRGFGNIASSSIWTAPVRGRDPVPLTDNEFLNTSPVWVPDGRHLLFVSNRGGARDVYQGHVSDDGVPSGPPIRLTTGLDAHSISLSTDGRQLAYSVFTLRSSIWSIRLPDNAPISVSEAVPVTTGNEVVEAVNISRDGEWLVFDSDRNGSQDIYRMPRSGGDAEQLTNHPGDEFNATLSPDGREIAFHSFLSGNRDIYVMTVDGGSASLQQVTKDSAQDRIARWSPDGRQLVFGSDRTGRYELWLIAREGEGADWGSPRQLTNTGTSEEGPPGARWSPDGRLLVFNQGNDIWVISPDGSDHRLIIRDGYDAQWLDDRTVYYRASDATGEVGIWSAPVSGGTPKLLVRFDDPSRQIFRAGIATDGEHFFFLVGERQSDIWVMELLMK